MKEDSTFEIDPYSCEGCGACVYACPVRAITFVDRHCGHLLTSETRFGKMIHARLGVAAENSGKLVSQVRQTAKETAQKEQADWILVDGPPGIGCPVIASIGGADGVMIVSEPSLSGLHDLERVLELTKHLKIRTFCCVNKSDINPELSERIRNTSEKHDADFLGKLPYDEVVTKSQLEGKTVIEYSDSAIKEEVKKLWNQLQIKMN